MKQKMIKCKFLILFILCHITIAAIGQEKIIIGRVINGLDSTSNIGGASVLLFISKDSLLVKGTLTDSLGNFELTGIEGRKYYLKISYVGYKIIYKVLNIDTSTTSLTINIGNVKMIRDAVLLADVKIIAERQAFIHNAEGIKVNLSNEIFRTSPDILDVLKKSPNIQVDANGKLSMRNSVTPKVLIDGRDPLMTEEQVKIYLTNLRPDEVESIDIITSPSAKYDAEYKGVVNIHRKLDMNLGVHSDISSRYQQNQYGSIFNSANLTYKTKKVTYKGGTRFDIDKNIEYLNLLQTLNNNTMLTSSSQFPSRVSTYEYMGGVEYTLSKNELLGVELRGYFDKTNKLQISNSEIKSSTQSTDSTFSNNKVHSMNTNFFENVYYERKYKRSTINFSTSFAQFTNNQAQYIVNKIFNSDSYENAAFYNTTNLFASQLDYSPNLERGKINLGAKVSSITVRNNTTYQNLLNNIWYLDSSRSNKFNYNEFNYAMYLSYGNKIRKLEYQFGSRLEYTQTKGNLITSGTINKKSYTKILPSLSLNYPINSESNISLSYTSRISRPSFRDLNPFIFYINPYQSYGGNQNLLPTIEHSYSFNYFYKKLSLSLNFGDNVNDIQQVPTYNPDTKNTEYKSSNIQSHKYAGIEVYWPIKITTWWSIQPSIKYYRNGYSVYYNISSYKGNVNTQVPYFGIEQNHYFKFFKDYNFSISYFIVKGGGFSTFNLKRGSYANIGVGKMFFGRLNINLNIQDPFNTYYSQASSIVPPQIVNIISSHQTYSFRYISLQLTYSFGKSSYRAGKSKNSAKEEEERANR